MTQSLLLLYPPRCVQSLCLLLIFWGTLVWNETRQLVVGVSASSVPHLHHQQEQLDAAHTTIALPVPVGSTNQNQSTTTTMTMTASTAQDRPVIREQQQQQQPPPYRRMTPDHHDGCIDLRDECGTWKEQGLCETTTSTTTTTSNTDMYMLYHCARTCGTCHVSWHRRLVPVDQAWSRPVKSHGDHVLLDAVGAETGVVQIVVSSSRDDSDNKRAVAEHVQRQGYYLRTTVQRQARYATVRDVCRNQNAHCTSWALQGGCISNAAYMNKHCPVACFTCHELSVQARCPVDRNAKNAWYPGDLQAMFERITSNEYFVKEYGLTVLSRPSDSEKDDAPWVVQLDHFFTTAEAQRLLELGALSGFERSTEITSDSIQFVSNDRTSESAWCDGATVCLDDPVVVGLYERMANLTHIDLPTNAEFLQFLRYNVGGYYTTHHDYIPKEIDLKQGVRILTIFMYLNDGGDPPLKGGGTHFPRLDLVVEPKVGRAVIWPSVLNEDPHFPDYRTEHQSLNVTQGQKFGVNAWIHQRKFKISCTQ